VIITIVMCLSIWRFLQGDTPSPGSAEAALDHGATAGVA